MTMIEFINNLFLHHPETPATITVEGAAYDLKNFKADGVDLPDDITPETYAEAWNDAVAHDGEV